MMLPTLAALAIVLFFASAAAAQAAQDPLATARRLYASAAYEDALAALGKVAPEVRATAGTEIDKYRVLCLIALSRPLEADRVIESIIASDPFYQPDAADASPRVRTAFNAVRNRTLPVVARKMYADAKAAYDRKAYQDASRSLEKTIRVIDLVDAPRRGELTDLRLLAAGFLDLSRAAVDPAPAPVASKPFVATPSKPAERTAPAELPSTDLVILKQELPPLPTALLTMSRSEYRGLVEVDIDETGSVTVARMLQSVHASYDPLLLRATRDWKYEAPRVSGKPIASRKRVEILLKP